MMPVKLSPRSKTEPPVWARFVSLDGWRGAAILLMLVDHVVLVTGGPDLIRLTLGRLAMPAFFVLAGHLARRPNLRHARVALIGACLPLVVPWIDAPNVLVIWAVGVVVLAVARYARVHAAWLVAVGLTVGANHWSSGDGFYEPAALIGLMALGAMLPVSAFDLGAKTPRWVQAMGRHPVAWYVGHLLALQAVLMLVVPRVG